MKEYLKRIFEGKKILILGFGKEGKSSLRLLSFILSTADITISDKNESVFADSELLKSNNKSAFTDSEVHKTTNESAFAGDAAKSVNVKTIHGNNYLDNLLDYDYILKSPGIKLDAEITPFNPDSITSQTDLFLHVYGHQTIGVTGTKGKSTTSSLIYHIIQSYRPNTVFGGNIGIPLFDLTDKITPETLVVCELSSHQLQFSRNTPHISILLNIFQEHLDHYNSYLEYQKAKYNIALNQKPGDYFIFNASDENIKALIGHQNPPAICVPIFLSQKFDQEHLIENEAKEEYLIESEAKEEHLKNEVPASEVCKNATQITVKDNHIYLDKKPLLRTDFQSQLTGTHNRANAIVAAVAASLAGVPEESIEQAISTFIPLEHRLEYVGTYNAIKFYNDSISTIPEAAIAAIESLKPVTTLILGGFDRGIDYTPLIDYLKSGNVKNVVTTGPAGLRIFQMAAEIEAIEEMFFINKFDEAVRKSVEITSPGGSVLLSPAASSYNEFANFEVRGKRFKELVGSL